MVRFVLVGPNAGRTIGFSKDSTGQHRFNFVNGVMEIHPTKVNGRFITRMKREYSAYLEGEAKAHGSSKVHADGGESVRSETVPSDFPPEPEHPSEGAAIELRGDDEPEAGEEGKLAAGRKRSGSKASR